MAGRPNQARCRRRCELIANKGTETTIEELKNLYKLMAHLKATDESGIVLRGLPLNDETLILSYGDCSWANVQGLKSQEGIVVQVP